MTRRFCLSCSIAIAFALMTTFAGCGRIKQSEGEAQSAAQPAETAPPKAAIQLAGGEVDVSGGVTPAGYSEPAIDPFHAALRALQPLQPLIGTWQGVTMRAISGAKAIESPQWNWDFLTDREQPALVLTSESGPYMRLARLTYRTDRRVYQLLVTNPNGSQKVFEGNFTEKPNYSAKLTEKSDVQQELTLMMKIVNSDAPPEGFGIHVKGKDQYDLDVYRVFPRDGVPANQNHGLVSSGGFGGYLNTPSVPHDDLTKSGPAGTQHYDTVRSDRVRTGKLDGAGARHCIVSGGMGTRSLVFQGKPYYVCCDGCKAAFLADPRRWVAEFEQQAKP